MRSKILFSMAIVALSALASLVLPTAAPARDRDIEERLNYLQHRCDRGDRGACVEFGRLLEENRNRHDEWRRRHPEYWRDHPPVVVAPRVVEEVTPQYLKRLHRECERGNRMACDDFRRALETRPDRHDEWRRTHPEFWIWQRH